MYVLSTQWFIKFMLYTRWFAINKILLIHFSLTVFFFSHISVERQFAVALSFNKYQIKCMFPWIHRGKKWNIRTACFRGFSVICVLQIPLAFSYPSDVYTRVCFILEHLWAFSKCDKHRAQYSFKSGIYRTYKKMYFSCINQCGFSTNETEIYSTEDIKINWRWRICESSFSAM